MAAPVVQKDTLTQYQLVPHKYLKIFSIVNTLFNGNEINTGDFNNSRVIEVPDIRVDDYIVDSDIARIGADHYSGSQYTTKWKNGVPPIEWRKYSMSRHRSFGYTVFNEQIKYSPIKNLDKLYLARKMETTVLRDHDKYLMLAICSGRMTGKLIARTSADDFTSQLEDVEGINAAEVSCTGNMADYRWIAQPGENFDNEIQPSFATIQGMVINPNDPLLTLDALTLQYSENWWDSNMANSERFLLITSALELSFRDALIEKGAYVESGFDLYKNADGSGANGSSYLGTLRGSWRLLKTHPEFLPKVFTDDSYVVDPSPTLTDVATATDRTLRQVIALAAYQGSAQTHDYFADRRSEDGGTRFDGTEYVHDFSYDAWVIDQKSEGVVPIFLPDDPDGGDMDYTEVDNSFNRVAAALATARQQTGTAGSFYPASGPEVNKSRPEWYTQPYTDTNAIDDTLDYADAGDRAHTHPTRPGDNPIDGQELAGTVDAVIAAATARANSTAVSLDAIRRFSNDALFKVTTAGTTAASEPDLTGIDIGESVTDGTAVFERIL